MVTSYFYRGGRGRGRGGRGHCFIGGRERRRSTLCGRPSAAAHVPRLRRPVDPHPVPRWVRPPHRRPLRSRFVTGPPSLPLLPAAPARPVSSPSRARMRAPWMLTGRRGRARRPPRPIQPTAPPGLGGRDLRGPGRSQGDRRPAGCRLGPALAALPLAQRWMGRGLAPWSRRAGRRSVAPPRRERSTCGMIEVGKFRNVDCKCNSKTPPNRRDATTPGVMAGAATTGATAGTPRRGIFTANMQTFLKICRLRLVEIFSPPVKIKRVSPRRRTAHKKPQRSRTRGARRRPAAIRDEGEAATAFEIEIRQ